MRNTTLLIASIFTILSISLYGQTVFYVTPTGTGTGTSWADASGDLTSILVDAESASVVSGQPSEVWVAAGVYTPTVCTTCTDADRLVSFTIGQKVQLIGGFDGSETGRLQASPSSNPTILSGNIGSGAITDNSYNVVWCDNCRDQAGIEGFTIQDGYADRTAANGPAERGKAGAGIYLTGGIQANLNITRCFIENNYSEGFGAGMYFNGTGESSPVISETSVRNNTSEVDGAGVYAYGAFGGVSNPKFSDCKIQNNTTVSTISSASGAGLYVQAKGGTSNVDIDRSIISGNATIAGGNSSANGGGVYIQANDGGSSVLNVRNSLLKGNSAFSGGGLYLLGAVQSTFTNCTLTENEAEGVSGAGGGIYNNATGAVGSQLTTITNSIIYGNTATNNAGSNSDVFRLIDAALVIDHSLVDEVDCASLNSNPGGADVSTVTCNAGMIYNQDPLLTLNAELPSTSPAVNAGDNATAFSSGGDLIGNTRIQIGTVDLGAIESSFAPLPVELISFEATALESKIFIGWKVASEIDLAGYKLLRRNPAGGFDEVVFVPAMESGSYSYEDVAVIPGQTYYYQLISEDLDGTTYDSDLVTARIQAVPGKKIVSNLYPNPTVGLLNIELSPREGARTVYATVLNMNGQRMMFNSYTKDGTYQFDLRDLPNGTYVVRLREGDLIQTETVTIQH